MQHVLSIALVLVVLCGSHNRALAEPVRPRLYLDCGRDCSDAYYRQELNYFDWVRDRHDADFSFTVVTQVASNRGNAYTVTLRSARQAEGTNQVKVVNTQPDAQLAEIRQKLQAAMLSLLYDALRGTPHEKAFELALPQRTEQAIGEVEDGWDHWVIAPDLVGEMEAESNRYSLNLLSSLSVRRITETSKFMSVSRFERRDVSFTLEDDERVTGSVNGLTQRFLYAHSIGQHWVLGAVAVGFHDVYENYKLHLHGGPMLEWNLFPYQENARRQLRFAYQVGAWYARYFERSVLDRLEETRPYHALSMVVDINQAWGSIQSVVQANSFVTDPERWRLALGLVFSLRLVAGLALQFEGQAAYIQDQINLRARTLSDREVFLETRELQKFASFTGLFGFSYTFGSVHNTIVNPRFGRVDLEED